MIPRSVSNTNHEQPATSSNTQRQRGVLPQVYQNNMKVLLRREPSITAIVDQFSYVCLYHHNEEEKWEKKGYEGSMFLFEKSTQPPYGIYILNRMGKGDYIHALSPEDDMKISGDYLMYRHYPDFTQTRLDMGLPYPIPEEHLDAFNRELSKRLSPDDSAKDKEKEKRGRSITLCLWTSAKYAREPLKEVVMRLHSYVKQGLPYPDQFRYGLDRPQSTNQHLDTAGRALEYTLQDQGGDTIQSTSNGSLSHARSPSVTTALAATGGSALDRLFAPLLTPSPSVTTVVPQTAKSVNDLHAASHGNGVANQASPAPINLQVQDRPASRGIALLNTIFASAVPTASSSNLVSRGAPSALHSKPEDIVIVSPKPTSSALPQILNQDVISTLLGLGPDSRASSAAPSSVGSHRSAQRRYEGDNEYSEGDVTSEGEFSKSNTVRATPRGIPNVSVPQTHSSESEAEAVAKVNGSRRIAGDVTPRPPAGGMRLPPSSPPHFQQSTLTPNAKGKAVANGISAASPAPAPASAPRARPLVPFEANSDLWPYPRAPLDDRSFGQDDVVELDFTDTRALSDPAIFSSRLKDKKDKKGRKGRKEREREKEREKVEIEKGWDVPTQTQGQLAYEASSIGPVEQAATTPSQLVVVNGEKQPSTATVSDNSGCFQNGNVDGVSIKDAIVSVMLTKTQGGGQGAITRNDFVQELLTLIHTDSQFMDTLWQDYLARTT